MINLTHADRIKLREYLKAVLSIGTHQVIFEKKDRSIRIMNCTRDERQLNEAAAVAGVRSESDTAISVVDTDLSEWRSFTLENLVSVDSINKTDIMKRAQINLENYID